MRQGLSFLKRLAAYGRRFPKPRNSIAPMPYHRRLFHETLEDRRLLSAVDGRPSVASIVTPTEPQSGNIAIAYVLADTQSDACDLLVEYSPDAGATWHAATAGPGGNGATGLSSTPDGASHTFVWASDTDLASTYGPHVEIRITPSDAGGSGDAGTTGAFQVANAPVPLITHVVVAEASSAKNGILESNEALKITWGTSPGLGQVTSQTVTVDGQAMGTINGPYGGTYYSCPIGTLAVGHHTYEIIPEDSHGITSDSTGSFDVVAPVPPTIASVVVAEASTPKNGTLESNENLKITWAASSAAGIASQTVSVDGTLITPINGPYGGLYYSCPIGMWAAGSHTYVITATDSNGIDASFTSTFDVVAATDSLPTISGVVVSQAKGKITWNAADPDGVASCSVAIDGTPLLNVGGPYAAPIGANYSTPLPALAVGDHTYTITATDNLGHTATVSNTFHIVNSTGGPTIGFVTVSETKVRISWNAVDPDGVASSTLVIDRAAASNIAGPFTAASGVNFSAPLGQLAAGEHTYTITATDRLGNVSTLSATFTLTNPTAEGPTIGYVTVAQSKARISWNAVDPDGVRGASLELDGLPVADIAGPFAATSGVNFSASLSSLSAGSHTYRITATDGSGNLSSVSGSFTLPAPSHGALSALASAASLSALSGSAKVDWLYDLGGLLNGTQSSSQEKDASTNAVDAALTARYS
jgi:large repetitive protein